MKDVWRSFVMDSGEQYVVTKLVLLKHLSFVDNLATLTISNINTSKGKILYMVFKFYNSIDLVILHCQYGLMSSTAVVLLVTVFSPVNNVLMLHFIIVIILNMSLLNAVSYTEYSTWLLILLFLFSQWWKTVSNYK